MKLWYWGREVLIKKVFDLIQKRNIKKASEAVTPIVVLWSDIKLFYWEVTETKQKIIQKRDKVVLLIQETS